MAQVIMRSPHDPGSTRRRAQQPVRLRTVWLDAGNDPAFPLETDLFPWPNLPHDCIYTLYAVTATVTRPIAGKRPRMLECPGPPAEAERVNSGGEVHSERTEGE